MAAILSGVPGTVGLNAGIYMLLLVYAVIRWGSGREALIAVGVLVVVVALGRDRDWTSTVELLLEIAILSIAGVSGLAASLGNTSRAMSGAVPFQRSGPRSVRAAAVENRSGGARDCI